jgi:hypothetical protein
MNEDATQQRQAEINYIDSMLNSVTEVAADESDVVTEIIDSSLINTPAQTITEPAVIQQHTETDMQDMYQIISVLGISLAVSLAEISQPVEVGSVMIDNDQLIHDGVNYCVADIASLIKPPAITQKVDQYLLIANRNIAIACEKLLNMETIDSATVRLRDENSKRFWLAGTSKQQGIAIIDMAGLQKMVSHDNKS